MTQEMHQLRVVATKNFPAENVDEKFVMAGLLKAREKTLRVMHEIREAIKPGITEDDARKLALEIFRGHGVVKHWHKPYIRFGRGTALTFHDPLQPDYQLQVNDPLYIDLGPVWPDQELGLEYEGDVGDTFVLGTNPLAEDCAKAARQIFAEGQEEWNKRACTGAELYRFLEQRTEFYGYKFANNVDGHRLSDFPHHKYSRDRLAQLPFVPSPMLWVLEVQIMRPDMSCGAFFEDMLINGIDMI